MRRGYVPNPGFTSALESSPLLAEELLDQAEHIRQAAEEIAEAELDSDGHYVADLAADRVGVEGGRVAAYVDARNFKSHWIEWGSINNHARHVLSRAVERVGLRLRGD